MVCWCVYVRACVCARARVCVRVWTRTWLCKRWFEKGRPGWLVSRLQALPNDGAPPSAALSSASFLILLRIQYQTNPDTYTCARMVRVCGGVDEW